MESHRSRSGSLFAPDERCLGGALQISEAYSDMMHRLSRNSSKKDKTGTLQSGAAPPTARQLSLHRARKRAQSDVTELNHQLNLHHLHRRMGEQDKLQNRKKNPHDPVVYPPPRMPSGSGLRTQFWSQTGSLTRPQSASCALRPTKSFNISRRDRAVSVPPTDRSISRLQSISKPAQLTQSCDGSPSAGNTSREQEEGSSLERSMSSSSSSRNAARTSSQKREWEQLKRAHSLPVEPKVLPVKLPLSRHGGPTLLPSVLYKLYHEALMSDILDRQLYKEAQIQSLCKQYLEVNGPAHRDVLDKVIADVKKELEVR